jgi:hypothetical protein
LLSGFRRFLPPAFNAGVYLGFFARALVVREKAVGTGILFLVLPHKFYGGKEIFPPVNHAVLF